MSEDKKPSVLYKELEASNAVWNKIAKAKVKMQIKSPFYGNIAMGMDWICASEAYGQKCPTMCTDGISIFFNPVWVEGLNIDELIGVAAHEVGHKVLKHHLRCRGRDHMIWNIAGDFAINDILIKDGFTLPKDGCIDAKYANWNAEKIYNDLMKDQSKAKAKAQSWGQFFEPGNEDGSKKSQEELAEEGQKVDGAARQATQASKLAGKQPGHLSEVVERGLEPEIDYEELIYKIFMGHGKPEYSMKRPNKSILTNYDMFSVGHDQIGAGVIGIGADVSGSIGNVELMHILGIINAIIERTCPEKIVVIQFDHVVSSVTEYAGDSPLPEFGVTGRGGTDFKPQFDEIEKRELRLDQYLVITDGYGPFPTKVPDVPVTWLMTTDVVAPFGITVPFKLKGVNS